MRRFEFRLERVLRFRWQREQGLRQELGNVTTRRLAALGTLSKLESIQSAELARLRAAQTGTLDMSKVQWSAQFADSVAYRCHNQRRVVRELSDQVERKRLETLEARRDTKVLSRLRETQRALFLLEREREHQKTLDELVVHRRPRKGELS